METMTTSQPLVFTKEFRSACTDILSQAINGEIVGFVDFLSEKQLKHGITEAPFINSINA